MENKTQAYLSRDKLYLYFLIISACFSWYKLYQKNQEFKVSEKKYRQLSGYLTEKEHKLTEQKEKYNVLKSKLETDESQLKKDIEVYRNKYIGLKQGYDSFLKENNLTLQQYEHSVYSLKQTVKSLKNRKPDTKIVVQKGSCEEDTEVSFTYNDPYKRLSFTTPNCLATGSEVYSLNQFFSVYGEVHQEKDGLLKVNSVTLSELDPRDQATVIAQAKLIKSNFKYFPSETKKISPPLVTMGLGFDSKLSLNILLGYNLFSYRNLYLNTGLSTTTEFSLYPYLGLIYQPKILGRTLNFGLFNNIGYHLNDGLTYIFGLDFFVW